MAYAGDLKSLGLNRPCGFKSRPGHHSTLAFSTTSLHQLAPSIHLVFVTQGRTMAIFMAEVNLPFGFELSLVRQGSI